MKLDGHAQTLCKFRHFNSRQALVTGGRTMPSCTLGSPLYLPIALSALQLCISSPRIQVSDTTMFGGLFSSFSSSLFPHRILQSFSSRFRTMVTPPTKCQQFTSCPRDRKISSKCSPCLEYLTHVHITGLYSEKPPGSRNLCMSINKR